MDKVIPRKKNPRGKRPLFEPINLNEYLTLGKTHPDPFIAAFCAYLESSLIGKQHKKAVFAIRSRRYFAEELLVKDTANKDAIRAAKSIVNHASEAESALIAGDIDEAVFASIMMMDDKELMDRFTLHAKDFNIAKKVIMGALAGGKLKSGKTKKTPATVKQALSEAKQQHPHWSHTQACRFIAKIFDISAKTVGRYAKNQPSK